MRIQIVSSILLLLFRFSYGDSDNAPRFSQETVEEEKKPLMDKIGTYVTYFETKEINHESVDIEKMYSNSGQDPEQGYFVFQTAIILPEDSFVL